MAEKNKFGQSVGDTVAEWTARSFPPRTIMTGRLCRLEPLSTSHARDLFEADHASKDDMNWTYLSTGPFHTVAEYEEWCAKAGEGKDPQFFATVDNASGRACGRCAFMRIDPQNGVIEIGHIKFSPNLQRTAMATEAMFLMMRRAFDELGYRRLEWKCDSLNEPSRNAAQRLGFQFEGVFRQAVIVKGRNRDTAWFSIIDSEWPSLRQAFETWLSPDNFSADGKQRKRLSLLTEVARGL